ncbi:hypothetical protein [Chryseosolibacter indicus]|uniref:Uncharacterized protein n=1 Tax=Chryseosolibacter indicus TaxID=2782351 RepID=A0ABS5VXR3_9BACT|nr:hypothetical protein [Chryseosolibacter indicus]MBT1706198.1 hypothetical protein [Chryseosolibacter indicus]
MRFQIEDTDIELTKEGQAVRLKTSTDNLLLTNQTFEETEDVVKRNFLVVKEFYQKRAGGTIKIEDLNRACLKIVFRFFYMHNMWRSEGKRLKNKKLEFLKEDLEHPYSFDDIIEVFKGKYPQDYSDKCEVLMNMTTDNFKKYEKNRQDFFNMW